MVIKAQRKRYAGSVTHMQEMGKYTKVLAGGGDM